MLCPNCGSSNVCWKHRRTRTNSFIWDDPEHPISVIYPVCSYICKHCLAAGSETISTDITIDKTNLSYHYLIKLLRAKLYSADTAVYDFQNLLYGALSEESVKLWHSRFHVQYRKLSSLMGIGQEELLNEKINFGNCFGEFFIAEGKFFLCKSNVTMLIYIDKNNRLQHIRPK